MKTIKKVCNSILIALILCSCSTLRVKVDVLNRQEFLRSDEYVTYKSEKNLTAAEERALSISRSLDMFGKTLPEVFVKNVLPEVQLDNIPISMYADLGDALNQEIAIIKRNFVSAAAQFQLEDSIGQKPIDPINDMLMSIYDLENFVADSLASGESDQKKNALRASFREQTLPLITEANLPIDPIQNQEVDNLLGDYLASFVAHSDEKKYWDKYKGNYNLTRVKTRMGNSDIAISMNGPGEYTIKGVRMDPSDVVKASFKTLKLGISLLASAQGFPVNLQGGGTPQASTSNYGIAADTLSRNLDNQREIFRRDAIHLIKVIENQRENLKSDNAQIRAAAISTINSAYNQLQN